MSEELGAGNLRADGGDADDHLTDLLDRIDPGSIVVHVGGQSDSETANVVRGIDGEFLHLNNGYWIHASDVLTSGVVGDD